jgi:hypothetical protein
MHQKQRNSFALPRPCLLVDEMHLQVLHLGSEMMPLGYLLLRLWPRVGILPVALQLVDPLE